MANIASSKKDARRSARRAIANRAMRSAVKTRIVKVRRSLGEGDSEQAQELAREAVANLDRAAAKGVLHRNNAARRKARLMKRLNAAQAEPAPAASKPAAPSKGARASAARASSGKSAAAKASAAKASAAKTSAAKTSGAKTSASKTRKKAAAPTKKT